MHLHSTRRGGSHPSASTPGPPVAVRWPVCLRCTLGGSSGSSTPPRPAATHHDHCMPPGPPVELELPPRRSPATPRTSSAKRRSATHLGSHSPRPSVLPPSCTSGLHRCLPAGARRRGCGAGTSRAKRGWSTFVFFSVLHYRPYNMFIFVCKFLTSSEVCGKPAKQLQ